MAEMQVCEACGASVYPEHVDQGRAGRWAGQLLCAVCYAEKRSAIEDVGKSAVSPEDAPAPTEEVSEVAALEGEPIEDEPISLVDVDESEPAGSKIQSFSQKRSTIRRRKEFKRPTVVTGKGATRVRTFHSKIQVESIDFLDQAINEWLDENPDVEVKFVTSAIGVMAGKHPEPNLILNLWY
ncbi:MAG: hypothetical protein BIFFINMI_04319 [Phycisphaerae bacterium]|nr:hypothetical protein [Phycisphaerae bacterium]